MFFVFFSLGTILFSLQTLYRFMVWFDLFIPSVVLGFYHVQWFCFLNKIHKIFQCLCSVFGGTHRGSRPFTVITGTYRVHPNFINLLIHGYFCFVQFFIFFLAHFKIFFTFEVQCVNVLRIKNHCSLKGRICISWWRPKRFKESKYWIYIQQ